MRIYVGVLGKKRQIFTAANTPTADEFGQTYNYVIGPFRTRAGASIMAEHGENNPHIQHVADAERIARQKAD